MIRKLLLGTLGAFLLLASPALAGGRLPLIGSGPTPAIAVNKPGDCVVLGPTSIQNYNPNGWVMRCTFHMSIGGTFDASKLTLSLAATPGFDSNCSATTTARTLTPQSVPWLRLLVPNETTVLWRAEGAPATNVLYIPLSDFVYQGEPVVANFAQGFYTTAGGSNPSLAATLNVRNLSTFTGLAPIRVPMTQPYQVIQNNSLHVESFYSHPYGANGATMACVQFKLWDATANSFTTNTGLLSTTTVTSMTASTVSTGQSLTTPVYAANINTTGVTDGMVFVSERACPVLGTACYDSRSDGTTTPYGGFGAYLPNTWTVTTIQTVNPPRYIPELLDAAVSYPKIYAYFASTGNDSNSCATTTPTSSPASPCLTIFGAMTKGVALSSHADTCNVWAEGKETFDTSAGFGGSLQNLTRGKCWGGVENDTTAAAHSLVLSSTNNNSTLKSGPRRGEWRDVNFVTSTNRNVINCAIASTVGVFEWETWWQDSIQNNSSSSATTTSLSCGLQWFVGGTLNNPGSFGGNSGLREGTSLIAGALISGGNGCVSALGIMANQWTSGAHICVNLISKWPAADGDGTIGRTSNVCVVSNKWPNLTGGTLATPGLPGSTANTTTDAYLHGGCWVNNSQELANAGTGAKGGSLFGDADGGGSTPVANFHRYNNGLYGDGENWLYNEANWIYTRKIGIDRNNIDSDWNIKADCYAAGSSIKNALRVGNMESRYHVGSRNNYVYNASNGTPACNVLIGDALGTNELYQTGYATSSGIFVDDESFYKPAAAGTGSGNYHSTVSNPGRGMVSAAQELLPLTIDGQARTNGMPGPYNYHPVCTAPRPVMGHVGKASNDNAPDCYLYKDAA